MLQDENLTFFSPLLEIANRSIQVLNSNGQAMTDDVAEEAMVVSEEEEVPELTIEERQEALKRSRWNVFMYLGLSALFFGFALYPFMSTVLYVDEGIGSIDKTIDVWGMDTPGEGFSDIAVEVEVVVQSIPTDVQSIDVYMIENPQGCDSTDGSIGKERILLQDGNSTHPNNFYSIDKPVESQSYDIEFNVDPGIYCVQIVVNTNNQNFEGINVETTINMYPTQLPLALVGIVCLLLSGFAFIGAQKNGKYVKSLIEPKVEPSIEDKVLSQTSSEKIIAGPSGPPSGPTGPPVGPTGPPVGPSGPPSGPTGPPTSGPTGPPVVEQAPTEVAATPEPDQGVYEPQGDGWYFRKLPDGTYDQTVYTFSEGQYLPHVESDA